MERARRTDNLIHQSGQAGQAGQVGQIGQAGQAGQVLLEYVLLLVITIGISSLIMRALVRRDPAEPGALLNRWNGIITQIGKDDPNKTGP